MTAVLCMRIYLTAVNRGWDGKGFKERAKLTRYDYIQTNICDSGRSTDKRK